MKILFLTDNFPPESNAPANRTYEHALEWINKGAAVTVITCVPNFPKGKVYAGYKNRIYQSEMMDGIKVIRVWSYMSLNKGVLRRTLDYISYGVMAFFASLFVKTDVIIATTPQFFTALFGQFAAFVKRKPWIMEVRDLWPESIKAVDAIKHNRIINFLEKIELYLYRQADRIIVNTDSFKENISARGIDAAKIDIVKNGVVLHRFPELPRSERLERELGLQGKFVVGYLGTHGMAHKLSFILDSAKNVTDEDIHFVFVGNGAQKEALLQQKEQLNLSNVTMLPSVGKEAVKEYISLFDVALVPLRKNETFKTVIPSKIFENAAMGKPILLGLEGECQRLIEAYEAGLCFEPEDEQDFIVKLNELKSSQPQYLACHKGALRMASAFDRQVFALDMLKVVRGVVFEEVFNGVEREVLTR